MDEDIYRRYVAESLYANGSNKRLTKSYSDIITVKPKDTRTPEEIKNDIIKRAGLVSQDESV